jgi:hypothetical protein
MNQIWIICDDGGGKRCHKLPCFALIESDINIKKFRECFYSHHACTWRLATAMESAFPKCLTCAAKTGGAQPLQQTTAKVSRKAKSTKR